MKMIIKMISGRGSGNGGGGDDCNGEDGCFWYRRRLCYNDDGGDEDGVYCSDEADNLMPIFSIACNDGQSCETSASRWINNQLFCYSLPPESIVHGYYWAELDNLMSIFYMTCNDGQSYEPSASRWTNNQLFCLSLPPESNFYQVFTFQWCLRIYVTKSWRKITWPLLYFYTSESRIMLRK